MSTLLDSSREDASQRDWQHILHFDAALLLGLLAISVLGLFVLYSSAGGDNELVVRQIIRLGIAFGAMVVVAQLRPQWLQRWTPWLYGLGLTLLIAVLVAGDVGKGAQRWLDLGFVRFQPSEMMKLAVPMMVAWYLSDKRLPPTYPRLLIAGVLIVTPVMLIAVQPDLGTSLLIASAGFFALFLAGLAFGQTVLSRSVQAAGLEWNESEAHSAIYDTEKTAALFCAIVNRWKILTGL